MIKKVRKILQAELIRPETALAVSFITPVVLYLIMFVMRGVWPFGDSTILGSDLYHQYGPFFSEFRHKLRTGGSLFYTWNMGLGMNFWALFAYYLSSPVNLLAVAVPQKLLVEFMTVLIVVKIGLCSLSMAWYLRKHCGSHDFGVAFFGILYGMSGYVTAYHWNIMWMDCIILFPLVLWGLEKLVDDEDGLYYCILLGLSVWSNYYISIMTCLFLVLYFPVLLVLGRGKSGRQIWNACLRFAGYSLLAGGLAAVLWVPEWMAIQMSYAGELRLPQAPDLYFSVFPVLARHLANVRAEYELAHWPNIYCGAAVLLLVPLYLSCGQIRLRERLAYGSLAALLLASFCFEMLDYVWHGLHFPNCFPARESYLYIFLLLFMSYRVYTRLPELPFGRVLAACLAALVFILFARKFSVEMYFRARSYWLSAFYLVMDTFCIWSYQSWKDARHQILLLAFSLVAVETLFTVTDNGMFDNSRKLYTRYDAVSRGFIEELQREYPFFRMKKTPADKANDGAWLHYPAMAAFCSTNYYSVYEVMHRLGCESHPNYYSNNGATPLVDMLFGISCDLSFEEKPETAYRTLLARQEGAYLYGLSEALPVGFQSVPELSEALAYDTGDPVRVQNYLAELCGAQPVLLPAGQAVQEEAHISFDIGAAGEYFAYIDPADVNILYAEFSDKTRKYETWMPGCLVELGYCDAGETVVVTSDKPEVKLRARLYRFDGAGLSAIRERLVKSVWEITDRTDTSLEGNIQCQEDGMMVTTIPYDPGWTVWVDGKKQEADKVLGAFLGVPLSSGTHEIRMCYMPFGLDSGGEISLGCLLVLLVLADRRRMKARVK